MDELWKIGQMNNAEVTEEQRSKPFTITLGGRHGCKNRPRDLCCSATSAFIFSFGADHVAGDYQFHAPV